MTFTFTVTLTLTLTITHVTAQGHAEDFLFEDAVIDKIVTHHLQINYPSWVTSWKFYENTRGCMILNYRYII